MAQTALTEVLVAPVSVSATTTRGWA